MARKTLEQRIVESFEKYKKHLEPGRVSVTRSIEILDIDLVNCVTQMRTEFTGIEDLAESIASEGLIQQSTAVMFNGTQAKEYLDMINYMHGTKHRLSSLVEAKYLGKTVYYILICGERRLRALKHLWYKGCQMCRGSVTGKLEEGVCFKNHFNDMSGKSFHFSVSRNTVPPKGLLVQFAENSYVSPGAHALAAVYGPWYKLKKLQDPKTTIQYFANSVGKSPQTISKYIGYVDLPSKLRKYVENGKMKYDTVAEISRYQKAGANKDQLMESFVSIGLYYKSTRSARKYINGKIDDLNPKQIKMFEMVVEKPAYKKIVDPQIAKHLVKDHEFFSRLADFINDGFLTKEDNLFSDEVQLRYLSSVIETETEALPVLKQLVDSDKYNLFKTALGQLKRA
ncbi:MAG: hypothetical protein ACI88L_000144 [Candidatus Paceibacteria bacterium]|jgi:hypothetical protein